MKPILHARVQLSLLVMSVTLTVPAQTPQGSGVIAGFVRNADGGTAVSKAKVNIEVIASIPAVATIPPMFTDSSGRFVFANLPLGTYRLFASASGFVTREYGQQEFTTPGKPIALAAEQRLSGLALQLVPVGTISGEVKTNDGLPAVRVPVKATRTIFTAVGTVQQTVKITTTDDRGNYRLFGLAPGPYFLSTGSEKPLSGSSADAVSTGDFAVQFYPGVATLDRAIPLDVTSGGELNVNLKTYRQRSVTVRGIIIDAQTGNPPEKVQWQLIYQLANGNTVSFAPPENYNPLTGEFELRNVWLGEYILEARTTTVDAAAVEAGEAAWAVFPVARVPIVVQDGGLENLRLFQSRPFEVTGRVRIDSSSDTPPLSGTVNIYPIDPKSSGRTPPTAKVGADGTFRILGLVPGEYVVRFQDEQTSKFYTKNITYNANDILNFPWQLSGSGSGIIDIVRRVGTTRLTGAATNARSENAAGARIVLLPEARFRPDLYKSSVADRNGRFALTDIVPGEYKLFAFDSLATGDEFDPNFMKAYEAHGYPIHVIESMTNSMDIRVVSKP